jgi:hypothetical protein
MMSGFVMSSFMVFGADEDLAGDGIRMIGVVRVPGVIGR